MFQETEVNNVMDLSAYAGGVLLEELPATTQRDDEEYTDPSYHRLERVDY